MDTALAGELGTQAITTRGLAVTNATGQLTTLPVSATTNGKLKIKNNALVFEA